MAGHGGARKGAGRPSSYATEQKKAEAKATQKGSEEKRLQALALAWEHVEVEASKGFKWAIEMLIEHSEGRPGAKVQQTPDTEIRLIAQFPWGVAKCPHCGLTIERGEVGVRETLEPVRGEGERDVGREEEIDPGGGDDPGEGADRTDEI